MRRLSMARATFALACVAMVCGCSAILGDFTAEGDLEADGGTHAGGHRGARRTPTGR